jgi:hypothetical protein
MEEQGALQRHRRRRAARCRSPRPKPSLTPAAADEESVYVVLELEGAQLPAPGSVVHLKVRAARRRRAAPPLRRRN